MTLKEACKESLVILKQVMEEKLNATNVEVCLCYCRGSVSLSLSVLEASLLGVSAGKHIRGGECDMFH